MLFGCSNTPQPPMPMRNRSSETARHALPDSWITGIINRQPLHIRYRIVQQQGSVMGPVPSQG